MKVKTFGIAVDNLDYLEQVSKAVKSWEITTPIEVLVELNIGHNRCGVTPDEAVALSLRVKELEKTQGSVIFKGITGYEALQCSHPNRKLNRPRGVIASLLKQKGKSKPIANEIQAGGGVVCDILNCEKEGYWTKCRTY